MSARIRLTPDRDEDLWWVGTPMFCQFLQDVRSHYAQDAEISDTTSQYEPLGGLDLAAYYDEDPVYGARLANAVYTVAQGILDGTIPSGIHNLSGGDQEFLDFYRAWLADLVRKFQADGRFI